MSVSWGKDEATGKNLIPVAGSETSLTWDACNFPHAHLSISSFVKSIKTDSFYEFERRFTASTCVGDSFALSSISSIDSLSDSFLFHTSVQYLLLLLMGRIVNNIPHTLAPDIEIRAEGRVTSQAAKRKKISARRE